MSLGGTFRVLGRLFDHWESEHWTIRRVGDDGVTVSGGEIHADVEIRTPVCALLERGSGRTPADESVAIDGDGGLEYAVRTPLVPDDADFAPRLEPTEVRTTEDGSLVVSLAVSMPISDLESGPEEADGADRADAKPAEPASEGTADESAAHEAEADADGDRIQRHRPDLPAFEDTAYLRDVYEACETFAEMAAEIDMDVTVETVRRYMIDAGVHEPTRYNTGSESAETGSESSETGSDSAEIGSEKDDADASHATGRRDPSEEDEADPAAGRSAGDGRAEKPVVVADGIGLPEGLSVDEFVRIVKNSRTLYEVQREMGVEWTTARDLLKEYNLLDFVMGQLAAESELYVTREEVVDRIRESVSP